MKSLVTLFLLAAMGSMLAGCAKPVHKDWFAHDGSKADGTVKMALTWNPNIEIPQEEREQAKRVAVEKCKAWGYTDAEEFGGMVSRCTQQRYTGFNVVCDAMLAEITYQCIDATNEVSPMPKGKAVKK